MHGLRRADVRRDSVDTKLKEIIESSVLDGHCMR